MNVTLEELVQDENARVGLVQSVVILANILEITKEVSAILVKENCDVTTNQSVQLVSDDSVIDMIYGSICTTAAEEGEEE